MIEVNDSSADQESEVDTLLHNTEFGAPLREAREKASLSIADVAQSLLIPEDIVNAIENSQIEKLPPATFVIGYIRSYARVLNVSADEVIESYNRMLPVDDQVSSTPFVPAEQKDTDNKTAVVMIASIIVLLILTWWFQLDTTTEPEKIFVQDDVVDSSDLINAPREEEQAFIDAHELLIESEADSENDLLNTPKKVSEEKSPVTEISSAESKTDELILTAIGESWCEIVDASGKRLFYQLIKANEEKRLYGEAPFKVFLGDASKVRIEANNKTVDFSHLIVGNKKVANFEISADSEAISSNR
jgi:cytoskeleton protein RodZ